MGGDPSAEVPVCWEMDGKLEAGRAAETADYGMGEGVREPTPASTWYAASGALITDRLLEWPPDVFALTNVLLARAEAFRYALSPPEGVRWPPRGAAEWSGAVVAAGRHWGAWVEDPQGSAPAALADEWNVALEHADLPI